MAFQSYKTTPSYIHHTQKEDVVNVLVCQIKVWTPEGHDWFNVPSVTSEKCLVLNEVESIETKSSYKELISTATIRIPRGTIISKISKSIQSSVSTGNYTSNKAETDLEKATEGGQVVTDDSLVDTNGESVIPIKAFRSEDVDYGAIIVTRKSTDRVATDRDFAIGSRIQIKVGYVSDRYDENGNIVQVATDRIEEIKMLDDADELKMIFTGFITSCSASSPLEIGCENMASMLKKIDCPKIVAKKDYTVNDFFKSGGTFDLLKDTGLLLSPITEQSEIKVGKVNLDPNISVADIFAEWNKDGGLMAFVEPDGKHIRVGFANYVGSGITDAKTKAEYVSYSDNNKVNIVQFDWDVAQDNLEIVHGDKKYLAVKATGETKDGKKFGLTIRAKTSNLNELEVSDSDDFSIVNERTPRPKLGRKKKNGTRGKAEPGTVIETKKETKVDMKMYNVVPYRTTKTSITREELIEEAKRYWRSYSPNGISGSISLFGDVEVYPADTIGLIDITRPEIDGYYIVESVDIDFGVSGYRKKVKLPMKVGKFTKKIEIR